MLHFLAAVELPTSRGFGRRHLHKCNDQERCRLALHFYAVHARLQVILRPSPDTMLKGNINRPVSKPIASLLFLDILGFTTISSTMEPSEVSDLTQAVGQSNLNVAWFQPYESLRCYQNFRKSVRSLGTFERHLFDLKWRKYAHDVGMRQLQISLQRKRISPHQMFCTSLPEASNHEHGPDIHRRPLRCLQGLLLPSVRRHLHARACRA
jgi:hypothetical protein